MSSFLIKYKDGKDYSKKSGDKNKIHIDKIVGRNSIYGEVICHGTLVLSKYLNLLEKTSKISGCSSYFVTINFNNAFKYNDKINISNDLKRLSQKNTTNAIVNFSKNKNNLLGHKLILKKKYKITLKSAKSHSNLREIALLNLTKYVGMETPGENSIIKAISINFNDKFSEKHLKIYTKKLNKNLPVFHNKLIFNKFIIDFVTASRPKFKKLNSSISPLVKKKLHETLIPILIIGASAGIGNEILNLYKYNKKIKILATYNLNLINLKRDNIKIIKFDLNKNTNSLFKYVKKYRGIRIYYLATPKISIKNDDKNNINKYKNYYRKYPVKLIKQLSKVIPYIEFFYPSTIYIDDDLNSEYVRQKLLGEKELKGLSNRNIKINILRIDQLHTQQNLSFSDKKLPTFTSKLNENKMYRKKFFDF